MPAWEGFPGARPNQDDCAEQSQALQVGQLAVGDAPDRKARGCNSVAPLSRIDTIGR